MANLDTIFSKTNIISRYCILLYQDPQYILYGDDDMRIFRKGYITLVPGKLLRVKK